MRRVVILLLTVTLVPPVGMVAEVAYHLVEHRIVYGYWLVRYRPMTPDDVVCTSSTTVTIKPGEYINLPLEDALAWCGLSPTFTISGTSR